MAIIEDRLVMGLLGRHHRRGNMSLEQVDMGYDIALINWGSSIEDTKCNMNPDI